MPQALDSGDRKLLIIAGSALVVLVVIASLLSPTQVSGASGTTSSYSPAWNGAKAAYLTLQELGYHAERWEKSPTELSGNPANAVLILAEPSQTPSEEERFAIRDFLENGGRILATGADASRFLPDASSFTEGDPVRETSQFDALIPSPITRGAPQISMVAPDGWQPTGARQLIVYGNEDTAAVVTYSVGKGQVIWWGAATPLTNGGIRESGNLALFLNSVGQPGTRVLWDEYFHGVHGSLFSSFTTTPALWGALQFGLLFLAILATHSRRIGPVHEPVKVSRLSPLEFVETLGDLYNSAHARAAAVRIADQHFRFLLTRKLGLPINTPSLDLAADASRVLGWEQGPLLNALTQCDRAAQNTSLGDAESVELVQKLFDYSQSLDIRRSTSQERQPG